MAGDGRMFSCSWCGEVVVVCRGCDRGQRYCCREHAMLGRSRSQQEAAARYRRTPKGRASNRLRQERFRIRRALAAAAAPSCRQAKVTHHPSPVSGPRARLTACVLQTKSPLFRLARQPSCAYCGDRIAGDWLRRDFCRRRSAWYREHCRDRAGQGGRDRAPPRC